ncbi:MAG: FKBP-type peptidyl-prolyl cis-trans isomerase N-terminal domain-containing protein, partial [Bacteroidaceae bacterium]|nr:FKBP-type peptidyl-prolyl cis-trans isomerase N-terminal domain-containing protein [Bacteroidaceae bacterium]
MDKFSYGLGMGIGQNLLSMDVSEMSMDDFVAGLKAVLAGEKTELTHAEAQKVVSDHFRKVAEQRFVKIKEAGEA